VLSKGDDFPIHQTPDPIAFAGTDRNFYDRYFFNGYSTDGAVFFGAAHGVYPQLNIMDAAFSVRVGDVQHNLHASRHLHMERMDTEVGPIRIEVLEPLQRLRVIVDSSAHNIGADLVIEGRHFPIEEPRATRRNGPRIVQDVTRLTQLGRWSGWIEAGGRRIVLDPSSCVGTRDRSWGIRQVGMRDPQSPAPPQEFQAWWYWLPAHFADRVVHFFVNEDGDGKVWNAGMIVRHDKGDAMHLRAAHLQVEFVPGTRFPARGVVTALDDDGGSHRLDIDVGPRFFLSGLGYMNPDWTHGLNKGPLAVGYDEICTSEITRHEPPYQHVQSYSAVSLSTPDGNRHQGCGCFESIVMGRHAPSGLTSMYDVP
jgi:hypothetical protein